VGPTGEHGYFGPIDPNTRIGPCVYVFPNKETWMKVAMKYIEEELRKTYEKHSSDFKEKEKIAIEGVRKQIEEWAGVAAYGQYKFLSHKPNEKKIDILLIFEETVEFLKDQKATYYIDKNGQQMVIEMTSEYERMQADEASYKYVDSKTSPEDRK